MNYWMTTHWPPHRNEDLETFIPAGIWLPDGREQAGADIEIGDRVLVKDEAETYEVLTNEFPNKYADRQCYALERPDGRGVGIYYREDMTPASIEYTSAQQGQ